MGQYESRLLEYNPKTMTDVNIINECNPIEFDNNGNLINNGKYISWETARNSNDLETFIDYYSKYFENKFCIYDTDSVYLNPQTNSKYSLDDLYIKLKSEYKKQKYISGSSEQNYIIANSYIKSIIQLVKKGLIIISQQTKVYDDINNNRREYLEFYTTDKIAEKITKYINCQPGMFSIYFTSDAIELSCRGSTIEIVNSETFYWSGPNWESLNNFKNLNESLKNDFNQYNWVSVFVIDTIENRCVKFLSQIMEQYPFVSDWE
jgi:hypothetical protein